MTLGDDSWLVVDSEDEDEFAGLLPANNLDRPASAGNSTFPDMSAIQTATFTPDQLRTPPRGLRSPPALADESLFTPPPARTDSTIGNFTSIPSPSGPPPAVVPRPRPRPRVVIRKPAINNGADAPSTSFSHISDPVSTTTRTNDSIQPASAMSFGFSEAHGDAYSSLDIAERAKMRSRKKAQPPKRIDPPETNEVIELTSDEDELALKPTKRQKKQPNPKPKAPTKPRPKPTLRVKRAAVIPDGSPPNETLARNPQTSPAKDTSSSQLPPSTLPTIPPSTPPPARELTPLSSPLVTTRKRKRPAPSIARDDDEMDVVGGILGGDSPSFAEPPPPFFAPSSSSLLTDSGIEIPAVELLGGPGMKKKQTSRKKGTQAKTQNKGKKGKKAEMSSTIAGSAEDLPGITQVPFPPETSKSATKKGKTRAIDFSEDEEEPIPPLSGNAVCTPTTREEGAQKIKENLRPDGPSPPKRDLPERTSATPAPRARGFVVTSKPTPMSELIRRVNSQPSSPFPNTTRTYSPFIKSSRTMLAKIAPLHPNRRTPPPPPPRPPPPKKSKKQIEMEERIEEELSETVDGWPCLTDEERKVLRKARIDAELGFE